VSLGEFKRGRRLSPFWYGLRSLIILLILLPLAYAQSVDWFSAGIVKTELNVSSDIILKDVGVSPYVDYLQADVIFVPQNSLFQAVRSFESNPSSVVANDRARFTWVRPDVNRLPFGYRAVVEVANNAPRVSGKIPFPIRTSGFEKYLEPTEHIDSTNAAVIGQAHKLAEGEDDLFIVVSKTAVWVKNNIEYNLSTLTAEVSQSASWVLENRYGVCDELTSLFIAMLRALKIPARFVSGVAYTDSPQFPGGWGAHGWAEVYFPGVGWVPFDPTFGQFGWIDPGHIKLKESFDPQEPTTKFEWKARDVKVEVHDLDISALRIGTQGVVPFEVKFTASPLRSRVGFGSYNAIVLDVENLADYYVGAEFGLSRVTDMDIVGGLNRQAILKPHERQRLFWIVRVKENLDPSYQYELPINVFTARNDTSTASFVSGNWDIVYSLADTQSSVEKLKVTQKDELELACALERDQITTYEGRVDCAVQNLGRKEMSVSVCFESCQDVVVAPGTSAPVSFPVPMQQPGLREITITAKSKQYEKKAVLTLVRLDQPSLSIKNIAVPEEVSYGDIFTLTFVLGRESIAFPHNVTVDVHGGGAAVDLEIGELVVDQDVNIEVRSSQLFVSNPEFKIKVNYQDMHGNNFDAENSVSIRVVGVPWYKRLFGWLTKLF